MWNATETEAMGAAYQAPDMINWETPTGFGYDEPQINLTVRVNGDALTEMMEYDELPIGVSPENAADDYSETSQDILNFQR